MTAHRRDRAPVDDLQVKALVADPETYFRQARADARVEARTYVQQRLHGGTMSVTIRQRRRVLAYARKQIRAGKPYVFGAEGPNAFDCSGLFRQAWLHGTGGRVDVPHNAAMIANDCRFVRKMSTSRRNWRRLRVGDAIFYEGSAHPEHIAIFDGWSASLHRRMIFQAGDPQIGLQRVWIKRYGRPSAFGFVLH